MTIPASQSQSHNSMNILSRLLLLPRQNDSAYRSKLALVWEDVKNLTKLEFDNLSTLANLNHVVVRGMEVLIALMREHGDQMREQWASHAITAERARIKTAMNFLYEICAAFEQERFDVAVIKSLDHWPDLGSDLDLYSNADSSEISSLMQERFGAQIAPRSWGDRLARKWNFNLPGLPEAVEIHMGRLGQTGEQVAMAARLAKRTRLVTLNEKTFRVPSASDRLMISTLQRMYRHFYFRLCDIVDSAGLVESGAVNFDDLLSSSVDAGIWEGVATYLAIVSDYVQSYRGYGLELPQFVLEASRFGGEQIYFNKDFLRVPIMPQSAKLYGTQLAGFMRKRELNSGARLSLLPWLATAALVGQKITGSDKGIW